MNPNLKQLKDRLEPTLENINHTPIVDASVLIALTNEAKPKMLLTRRASHMKSHAGEVSFPGGKYEPRDDSNVATAVRESQEETSLNPEELTTIGQLPIRTSKSGLSVRPIVAMIEGNQMAINEKLMPEAGEIARIFWADFDWLIDEPTTEYHKKYLFDNTDSVFVTPSWRIDGEVVWGLTGTIIASLLEIGFDRKIDWYYKKLT